MWVLYFSHWIIWEKWNLYEFIDFYPPSLGAIVKEKKRARRTSKKPIILYGGPEICG